MWRRVFESGDLQPGRPRAVSIAGREILVVRTGAGLFALEDRCPHQKQPLSSGKAEGDRLTCRHHGIEIDMNSGRVTWSMGFLNLEDAVTVPVKEESGAIWVDV